MLSLRRSLLLAAHVFAATAMLAQMPMPMPLGHTDQNAQPEEIRELVSKYCRLDYDGARLNPAEWPKLQPLVWWKASPDFTQVIVISRYAVQQSPELINGKYAVTVHYRLLGRFDAALGYMREPSSSVEDTEFTVSATNGEWRIDDITPNFPHPSVTAMLKWLQNKINTTTDTSAKKMYQEALRQLQAPAAPPPSTP